MRTVIDVVEIGTGKVIKTVDCGDKSEQQVDKVEMGMLRNMNLERYSTNVRKIRGCSGVTSQERIDAAKEAGK